MTAHEPQASGGPLRGLNILVVEDEAIVSLLIEDMLLDFGCAAVWHASSIDHALELLRRQRPDAAVLDVNLTGEMAYPLASELQKAKVPFIFATGYGRDGIASQWASRPVLQKPFDARALEAALISVLR